MEDVYKVFRVKPNQNVMLKNFNEVDASIWEREETLKTFEKATELFIKYEGNNVKIFAASEWWFLEEWGRDTFVSIPGLLLVRGKFEEARKIFQRFKSLIRNGLVPNRITEKDVAYNSADSSLWFIYGLKRYVEYSKDWKFVEEMASTVENILISYINGTGYYRYGEFQKIYLDKDFLVVSPPQATWMDADAWGKIPPVTPRNGKVVEIKGLFYLALKFAKEIEKNTNYKMKLRLDYLLKTVKKSFREKFWDKKKEKFYLM